MRRVAVLFTALVLTGLIPANQASALGWRWQRRRSPYQACDCRRATAPMHHEPASAPSATPTAIPAKKALSQSVVTENDRASLIRLLDLMEEIVALENDRLDRELDLLEDDDNAYGSD